MKFPAYIDTPRSTAIIDTLIDDIAAREVQTETYYPELVDPYSVGLGALCVEAFKAGHSVNRHHILRPTGATPEQRIFENMYGLVLSRSSQSDQERYQQLLHTSVINSITRNMNGRTREVRGSLAEDTSLGLLTRYAHPRMLAYRALSHHEHDTDTAGHYDVGLLCASADDTVESYFLQVKGVCFGKCEPGKSDQALVSFRRRYRPLYQLVSGCCDLGIRGEGRQRARIPRLLVKEYQNQLNQREIKELDNLTDEILWKASCNLLPRGTNTQCDPQMSPLIDIPFAL